MERQLKQAIAAHQAGNLVKAKTCYQKILAQNPHHPDALHLLGVIAHQNGNCDTAVLLIKQAIRYNPNNPSYFNNLGVALREAGEQIEALNNYQKALHLKPDYAEAAYNMGSVFLISGNISAAILWYQKAVQINPNYVDAYTNLAAGYNKLNRPDKALICCQKALTLNSNCAEALNNMGNAYLTQDKKKEAIACFQKSISIDPVNPEAHSNMGNAFHDLGWPEEALACYQRALNLSPTFGEAYNNMGIVLREQGRLNEATFCYQKSMQLLPKGPEAYLNMGNVFKDQGKLNEAIVMYNRAIDRNSGLIDSYVNLGAALEEQGRVDDALTTYLKAMTINPEYPKTCCHLIHQLQHMCAWQEIEALNAKLDQYTRQALDDGKKPDEMPFLNLTRHADPSLNYKVAKAWSDEISNRMSDISQFHPSRNGTIGVHKSKESRIRLGYLSNNFKNHPTAHLIQGMFRSHNREKFEVFCYSYGEDDKSSYRIKIQKECDQFMDVRKLSHTEAARRICDDRVDILIDLVGYMKANRLCIPALRPAPVQVRWLGLAGTTGADFFDYIITDKIVTPKEHSPFYSEKLVYMPYCYQINDDRQTIRDNGLKRTDFGLPAERFVFCSFSTSYKFDPAMFHTWMKILKKIPGSVLWMLGGSKTAEENLKQAAESRGVSCNRLVFAKKIPREVHLARLRLADLALDTRIVNGAITTSDALWSGVPVITLQGSHFASRMSSSILSAAGLPELVTHSLDDFETLAVRLAGDSDELFKIRQKLVQNRLTIPLFDTARFVCNLEFAFIKMWELYYSGNRPRSIKVPDNFLNAL